MKKLSKAEEKRLVICRERAFDLLKRMEELVGILANKDWTEDMQKVCVEQHHCMATYRLLESLEHKQYMLQYGDTK